MSDAYQGTRHWRQGDTLPKRFTLKDGNQPFDLTGAAVTLELRKADGTLVASPGSIAVISPATSGVIEYTPADATVLLAKNAPYAAHYVVTIGGRSGGWPGKPERWDVYE